jgi:hypothetical protein
LLLGFWSGTIFFLQHFEAAILREFSLGEICGMSFGNFWRVAKIGKKVGERRKIGRKRPNYSKTTGSGGFFEIFENIQNFIAEKLTNQKFLR